MSAHADPRAVTQYGSLHNDQKNACRHNYYYTGSATAENKMQGYPRDRTYEEMFVEVGGGEWKFSSSQAAGTILPSAERRFADDDGYYADFHKRWN